MNDNNPIHAVPKLSVVVLCYKAGHYIVEFIEQLINELEPQKLEYELVLVANYDKNTSDPTPEIVKNIVNKYDKIRVVAREKKGKMGWDMRTGLKAATGEYIAVIDGDGQMPVSDIPIVYHIIKTGRYDLVKTFRAKRYDGWLRKILSKGYNFFFKIIYQPSFPVIDINSKPKILSKEALNKLHLVSNDWFSDSEIMIEAYKNNLRICQVSTVFYKNQRRSSFLTFKTIVEFICNLIAYRFIK